MISFFVSNNNFVMKYSLTDINVPKKYSEEVITTELNDVLRFGECYQTYWYDFKIWSLVDWVKLFTKKEKRKQTTDGGFKENEFLLECDGFKDL